MNREAIIQALINRDKDQLKAVSGKLDPIVFFFRVENSDVIYDKETGKTYTKEDLKKISRPVIILLPENYRDIPIATREQDVIL